MTTRHLNTLIISILVPFGLAACGKAAAPSAVPATAAAAVEHSQAAAVVAAQAHAPAAPAAVPAPGPAAAASTPKAAKPSAPAPHQPSAVDALNAMDPRTPVPLQPMMAWHQKQNMQAHLVAIMGIVAALEKEDWKAVAKSAGEIGFSPQMGRMCQHMGAGAKGFTKLALEFHHRADGIAKAAKTKDTKAVLRATAHTLQACTSCHATFRQDVVDAATWQKRTGSKHMPGAMHHGH